LLGLLVLAPFLADLLRMNEIRAAARRHGSSRSYS
jgi:hypothetical protein